MVDVSFKEGASFVGTFVSFPVEAKRRRTEILRSFLELENKLSFKRIKYGAILGTLATVAFDEQQFEKVVSSLEAGGSDFLQLTAYEKGDDWISSYKTSVEVDWQSSVGKPANRSRSPVEERFGDSGSMVIIYPTSRFSTDSESSFQKALLSRIRQQWTEGDIYWTFVNQGFRPLRPMSIGQDDVFRSTRNGFPLSSFDRNLAVPIGFFKEYVAGAFWANFLNRLHVIRLGGVEKILQERPSEVVERLDYDSLLLQVTRSPLTNNPEQLVSKYQELRRFLSPVLMETGEDMMRLQKEILGSWKPPEDARRKWQEDLAV